MNEKKVLGTHAIIMVLCVMHTNNINIVNKLYKHWAKLIIIMRNGKYIEMSWAHTGARGQFNSIVNSLVTKSMEQKAGDTMPNEIREKERN